MARRATDPGSVIPAAPTEATTQIVVAFDDNRLASALFGQYGQNLALIERRLGVVAEQRGNHVTLEGSRDGCEQARRVLEGLYEQLKRGRDLVTGDVEGAIRLAISVSRRSASASLPVVGNVTMSLTKAPSVRCRVSASQNRYHLTTNSLVMTRPRC